MRSKRAGLLLLIVCVVPVVVVAASACSDTATPPPGATVDAAPEATPGAPVTDGGCTLPGSFGSSKCNACIGEKCCDVLGTCSADATCKQLMACKLACLERPDAGGCGRDCSTRYSDDAGKWEAVLDCAYGPDTCAFHCAVGP